MNKVRWGILSTAKIGLDKVIPAMQRGQFSEVTAIASRSLESAQTAAAKLGIPKAYGSYGDLLCDRQIDAIYNPLPNHLHVGWSVTALHSGKHVLCEKPIGLSSVEGEELVTVARKFPQLKVMEAFMYRHHPQWQRAREIVRSGGVGQLRAIQSFFSYFNNDGANIRNMADIGGGALMDIGCYPISVSRFITGAEPQRVVGQIEFDPVFQTDRLSTATLDFGDVVSTFTCSTQLAPYQRVNIFGDQGRVEIEIPFNAPPDRPCRIWHQNGAVIEEILLPICDQYTVQGDLMSQAILNDTPVPTPIEDAVRNMRVIEAIFASAKSSAWAAVTTYP